MPAELAYDIEGNKFPIIKILPRLPKLERLWIFGRGEVDLAPLAACEPRIFVYGSKTIIPGANPLAISFVIAQAYPLRAEHAYWRCKEQLTCTRI